MLIEARAIAKPADGQTENPSRLAAIWPQNGVQSCKADWVSKQTNDRPIGARLCAHWLGVKGAISRYGQDCTMANGSTYSVPSRVGNESFGDANDDQPGNRENQAELGKRPPLRQ